MTLAERLSELERAVSRLDEALALEPSSIVRDGAIQRFEFSFELAWKSLKAWLDENLTEAPAVPKAILQEAYAQKLIDDEASWIAMLKDRNLTSHTYKEALALEIFERLPRHAERLRGLLEVLRGAGA